MGFKLRLFKASALASSSASSSNSDLHNQLSETSTATTTTTRTSSSSSFSRRRQNNDNNLNNSPTPPQSPKKKKFLSSLSRFLGGGSEDSDWLSKQPLKYPGKPDAACLAILNAFQWGNGSAHSGANNTTADRMLSYCSTTISPGTSRRGSLA